MVLLSKAQVRLMLAVCISTLIIMALCGIYLLAVFIHSIQKKHSIDNQEYNALEGNDNRPLFQSFHAKKLKDDLSEVFPKSFPDKPGTNNACGLTSTIASLQNIKEQIRTMEITKVFNKSAALTGYKLIYSIPKEMTVLVKLIVGNSSTVDSSSNNIKSLTNDGGPEEWRNLIVQRLQDAIVLATRMSETTMSTELSYNSFTFENEKGHLFGLISKK